MSSDADWVEDVRRWYFAGRQEATTASAPTVGEIEAIGYEAAHPALQARHWPDAPSATPPAVS